MDLNNDELEVLIEACKECLQKVYYPGTHATKVKGIKLRLQAELRKRTKSNEAT